MKTTIENMFKIILKQHRLIRNLPIRRQWKYKRKDLIVKPRLYVFSLLGLDLLAALFLSLLGLDLFYFFSFRISFTFTTRIRFTIAIRKCLRLLLGIGLLFPQVFLFYK